MDLDIHKHLDATTRVVQHLLHDGQSANAVVLTRTYVTNVDHLWDTITSPRHLPQWFLPVSGDLRLGGRFQLQGNAGGTIERCAPPRTLGLTWEFGEDTSWVHVRLTDDDDGRTQLTLEHVALAGEHWQTYGPGAGGVGWDGALMGLAEHLRTGEPADPEAAMAWMMSEQKKRFYRLASEAWGRAHRAAGADPAVADAAAARTAAFYTAEPPQDPPVNDG